MSCLLILWSSDSCGCDARRGDTQLWHQCQDIDRPRKLFKHFQPQESNIKVASPWQYKAAHKFTGSGSHHEILLHSAMPSTLQPQSSILIFPPIYVLKNGICSMKLEIYDIVIHAVRTWLLEQDKAWYWKHIHTHSLLAQGHKSGWILYVIVGSGANQSLFIMWNFYDLGTNTY
jgi:hypothetical protein